MLAQVFFWVSVGALVLVGVAQILSYCYSGRRDLLVNQRYAVHELAENEEVVRLHRQASVLTDNVAQSKIATAGANARAEEAEEDLIGATARAQEAQQALQRLKAPRAFSDETLRGFRVALKPFAGQQWAVTTFWNIKEPVNFANLLYEPLNSAGWKLDDSGSKGGLPDGLAGVQVLVHPQADTKVKAAAAALVAVLNKYGFNAAMKVITTSGEVNKIQINVGTKTDLADLGDGP